MERHRRRQIELLTRYEEFYSTWMETLCAFLRQLRDALRSDMDELQLKELVERAAMHYTYYYRVKDDFANENVLQFFSPAPWKTPLEAAFMWIGGWRPSLIFQLAYAQAGQQIEAELAELIAGIEWGSPASITAMQLERINELQVKTLRLEEKYTREEAVLQQTFADQPFVELAHSVTSDSDSDDLGEAITILERSVDDKLRDLHRLLMKADQLRRESLESILAIFNTTQAAHFLVAAAELQLAFRALGSKKADMSLEILSNPDPAEAS